MQAIGSRMRASFSIGVRLFLQELRRPNHYFVALGVGTILTSISLLQFGGAVVFPFLVPFLVSSVSRSAVRAANRNKEVLLRLPAEREDPTFVMCRDGQIEAALGNTAALFAEHSVTNINDFLVDESGGDAVTKICEVSSLPDEAMAPAYELYCPKLDRWYGFRVRMATGDPELLVWLNDVSAERLSRERRSTVRQFQIATLEDASGVHLLTNGDERLAQLILESGYTAVFFAREDTPGQLDAAGFRLCPKGNLVRSGSITISQASHAPIFRSRAAGHAVAADRGAYAVSSEFDRDYPVAPEVRSFIDEPVRNLVNYHAGATSIVAFNKAGAPTRSDLTFLEAAVDAAHSLFVALDVAKDRDLRFIQAIHGLCASAEFSDEITGSHIWRVNAYAEMLAQGLCVDGALCRDIGQVAAAHDIGKVAIPELVQAPRALSPDEWQHMQLHTVYGAQILERMIALSDRTDERLVLARDIALNHHQRWDGKGYPGLFDSEGVQVRLVGRTPQHYKELRPPARAEIPLAARIVSVCDIYDALRSARPYKTAFTHSEAVALIERDDRSGAGGEERFGPDVFGAFMDNSHRCQEIFQEMQDPDTANH
ncbi:MAG: HD domain-containing protein [Spirochaetaceae bacterium]|nr:MAG: HD domain-containing protein [Spirochaetaceae bacterium]